MKAIIEKLEKIRSKIKDKAINLDLEMCIAALEQEQKPICKTCGDNTGSFERTGEIGAVWKPCPDCQKPAEVDLCEQLKLEIAGIVCNGENPHADNAIQLVDKMQDIIDRQAKEIECLSQQMNGAMTIMKGRAKEVTELKHVLFENVIAPNCPTCSNQMSNYCDNGQICMSKLLNAEFVRWDIKKLEKENAKLKHRLNTFCNDCIYKCKVNPDE